ncbi:MAG: histidine phosphatase family protein, partial [Candidatus Thermoplasmatota archaeon]|nr:histidine phosphatase family protein [Candidatus Thermoplasmatota archaeon]
MISRLILMRHAKSSWKYPDLSDHERPLNKRGRKAAVKVAKELIRLEWIPDKLYSSDSERTKETWSRMNKHIDGVKVVYSH